MNKIGYMVIGAIFTLIISAGLWTFAESGYQVIVGEPVAVNSEVNRESADQADTAASEADINSAQPATNEKDKGQEHPDAVSNTQEEASSIMFFQQIKKLEAEIENDDIEIELKFERKKDKLKAEVEIEFGKEKLKLKGADAAEFIEQLFSSVTIQSAQDIHLAVEKLLSEFEVDAETVEVEIKVKTNDKEYEYKSKPKK